MTPEITALAITAATIGTLHTLMGPDHYIPFIVMASAREWGRLKTATITFLCGLGHILSSIILGFIGIGVGVALGKLEAFEGFRGGLAGWVLTAFGFAYFIWGIHRAIRNRPHKHLHIHSDNTTHEHDHSHNNEHSHVHEKEGKVSLTPWILFTIFVLGPCEPLIPILMYPAAKSSVSGLIFVTAVFAVTTLGTMLAVVMLTSFGLSFLPMKKMERYAHALAGFAIFACGLTIQFGL
ncbi:MAG: sulfite exporter TauE/SafE family protein [Planctomycetota bacterium]|jgi:sulfite exporter TauE/SafE